MPRPRLLPTALVLALLAGSAVAFAVSEGLKLQKRPITPTTITKIFSPVCRCPQARATIAFRLLRVDTITLTIVDSNGKEVAKLVDRRRLNHGNQHFSWDGKNEAGKTLLSGAYRPKVEFADIHRTFILPNPIHIDVVPPKLTVLSVRPRVFSPDGDGRADQVVVHYRVSEHAHAILLANRRQVVKTFLAPLNGQLAWNGSWQGRKLPPGTYSLSLVAVDLAGNRSRPAPAGRVRLRYLAVPAGGVTTVARTSVRIPVDTDAMVVRWTIRKGSSIVGQGRSGPVVSLRAPATPGTYVITLDAGGHRVRTTLTVRP